MRRRLRSWLSCFPRYDRRAREADLARELRDHLELEAGEQRAAGLSPEQASYAAHRALGNTLKIEEDVRAAWGFHWFGTFAQDIRYGLRQLRRDPGFTFVAVLTLALGIGANTALFSVVNGVLLNPLRYPNSGQLVQMYEKSPGSAQGYVTYLNFLDWQRESQAFSSMALYRGEDYNATDKGVGERVSGFMVTAEFFRTLGVKPVLGRTFRASDDHVGAAPVVILGGGFWKRQFGASRDVLGKPLVLNGASYTVIGVVPADFTFYSQRYDVYTPAGQWKDPSFRDRRIDMSAHVIGRLNSGVTLGQAQADMSRIAESLSVAYPDADKGVGVSLVSMKQDMVGNVRPFLLVLMGAVGFLLLIACANVANLLLVRSMGRTREFAVRAALGARHGRVIRQLLTENILLAGVGGGLGLLLASWGTQAVLDTLPSALPRAKGVALDPRVLIFTLAVSLLAGILFGLGPAFRSSRISLQEILNSGGRGSSGARHRMQGIFVALEMALALVLLVGAGLMIRSLAALVRVDPGFVPSHAITFDLSLPDAKAATPAETRARLRLFDAKIRAIPGVEAVSVTLGSRPMIHDSTLPFWIAGQPKPADFDHMHQALFSLVEAGYQKAMGTKLERGRFITAQDDENAPVVIDIDDVFARRYFPRENPVGRHIHLALFNVEAEIVGVVGHVKQWGLGKDPKSAIEPQFDYPFMQLPKKLMPLVASTVAVVVRTKRDPTAIMGPVRRAVAETDPREVIFGVETMNHVVGHSYASSRFSMVLLDIFAALALLLACVGIYGVISYVVRQQAHEIGVRMALGAQHDDILRLVLGRGAKLAFVGVAIGIVAALALTRWMASLLFGVSAHDFATFAGMAILLMSVALAACWIPARRAMKVDPLVALRYE